MIFWLKIHQQKKNHWKSSRGVIFSHKMFAWYSLLSPQSWILKGWIDVGIGEISAKLIENRQKSTGEKSPLRGEQSRTWILFLKTAPYGLIPKFSFLFYQNRHLRSKIWKKTRVFSELCFFRSWVLGKLVFFLRTQLLRKLSSEKVHITFI